METPVTHECSLERRVAPSSVARPPRRRSAGPQMKGTAFRSTMKAIEQVHGASALAAVKTALEPGTRDALDRILPRVSWYPVSLSAELHEAVRNVLGGGEWTASRRLGQEAAKIDFTGVYRVVLRTVQYDTSLFATRAQLAKLLLARDLHLGPPKARLQHRDGRWRAGLQRGDVGSVRRSRGNASQAHRGEGGGGRTPRGG